MKKNKIFRFASALSVLGISSLVISSCSQAQDSKKPEPKPTPGGGNNQSDQGNPGGVTNPPGNGTNPGNQTKPQNEADQVKSLIDGLNASSFKLVDTTNSNQDVQLDSVEAETVKNESNKYSFLLRDVTGVPSGWKYVVKATDADTKKGVVQVNVEFTKEGVDPVKSTKSIEVDGFKSLPTTVKNSFFTKVDLGEQYKGANKTALNVGDVKFAKLSEINKEKTLEEKAQTEGAAESTQGTSLREEAQVTTTTNGFQAAFMETLKQDGANKETADKIKETEPTFKAEDLYITGQATVDSIWQKDGEKAANFYLTSKDPAHPLKLKSKTLSEIDITIPGIVVKNILPDDVKISVSKVNVESVNFDPANQSNLEAYKKVAESEQEGTDKYKFENGQLFATVSNKDYKINPIHIPYIAQKNNHNIFFKARYIFDDKDMFTDAFTTKIAFKKITQNGSLSSEVVSIKELADQNNNKLEYFSKLADEKPDNNQGNIVDRFFWTGVGPNGVVANGEQSTDTEISGDQNKDDGEGVAQMVNWKQPSNQNNENELVDSNKDAATNYIIYTRIKYAKDDTNFGYSWSNQVTILHIDAPTSTTEAASTTTTDTASTEEK